MAAMPRPVQRTRDFGRLLKRMAIVWKFVFTVTPMVASVPVVMLPVGIITMVMGEGASRAFSLMPGGNLYGHVVGFLLAMGSLFKLIGMTRNIHLIEAIGAGLVGGGAFMYAFGVILGLGWNGIIAGGGFLAIAIGSAGRVAVLTARANRLKHDGES